VRGHPARADGTGQRAGLRGQVGGRAHGLVVDRAAQAGFPQVRAHQAGDEAVQVQREADELARFRGAVGHRRNLPPSGEDHRACRHRRMLRRSGALGSRSVAGTTAHRVRTDQRH
jgi:hypothetical protein